VKLPFEEHAISAQNVKVHVVGVNFYITS